MDVKRTKGINPLLRRLMAPLLAATILGLLGGCGGTSPNNSGSAALSPTAAADPPPQAAPPAHQSGLVTSVTPTSFTLRLASGQEQTFRIHANTWIKSLAPGSPDSPRGLQVGQKARVISTKGDGGILWAARVVFAADPSQACIHHPEGPAEPLARVYGQSAYRDRSDEMFVFSAQSTEGWVYDVRDMWSYHVGSNRWRYLGEQPTTTSNYDCLAYDASADRIVFYISSDSEGNTLETAETWAFDPETRQWENRHALNPPSVRWGAMMVYDAHARKSVLFAGGDALTWEALGDTWTYDYASNTWAKLQTAEAPPPMNFGAMAYDSRARRVVLFSGNCWSGTWPDDFITWNSPDTWTLDVSRSSWKRVPTAVAPEPRNYHRLVYDPWTSRVLMFGGCTGTDIEGDPLIPQNDTWAFHIGTGTWHRLEARNAPGPRGWHTMVFATRSAQAVIFAGGTSRQTATHEAWLYFPILDRWKNALE